LSKEDKEMNKKAVIWAVLAILVVIGAVADLVITISRATSDNTSDLSGVPVITTGFTAAMVAFAVIRLFFYVSLAIYFTVKAKNRGNISRKAKNISICPVCHSDVVLRTVRKGKETGKQFYVCIKYPECRGRVQIRKRAL
jgi:formate dehydrogenase maturation protein FdhE